MQLPNLANEWWYSSDLLYGCIFGHTFLVYVISVLFFSCKSYLDLASIIFTVFIFTWNYFPWTYGKTRISGNYLQFQSPSSVELTMVACVLSFPACVLPQLTWNSCVFWFHSAVSHPALVELFWELSAFLFVLAPSAPLTETSLFLLIEKVVFSTLWASLMFVFMLRYPNFPGMLSALRGFCSQLLPDATTQLLFLTFCPDACVYIYLSSGFMR